MHAVADNDAGKNAGAEDAAPSGHLEDFDFLIGRWHVRHRRLLRRLVGCTDWEQFDGACHTQKLLDDQVIVDDNVLHAPAGTYRALAIRVFDAEAPAWAIFWVDGRSCPVRLDQPVIGGFAGGQGLFFSEGELGGRPVRTRFIWHVDAHDSCRWEQAASLDGGSSWETNWYMDLTRAAS